MNPYWKLWEVLPHESLLNLFASKSTQNATSILAEIRAHFFRMNPYCIYAHLKLVKIWPKSLLKFVDNFPHESLVNLFASKPTQNSTSILTEMCGHFFRMNPFWIHAHLKLVKIWPKSLLKFVDNFPHESLVNLFASKPTQNSTSILTEICGHFFRMNPYWIYAHLKLVKIWPKSLLKFVDNFPHESLLNLCASNASQNWTQILTEICTQIFHINPYWICEHLNLVKIWHKSLLEYVDNFSTLILIEFVCI